MCSSIIHFKNYTPDPGLSDVVIECIQPYKLFRPSSLSGGKKCNLGKRAVRVVGQAATLHDEKRAETLSNKS